MNASPTTLVKVENLAVSTPRGRQLYQDLNAEIAYDQVAMIGRNGVGKTTLLKIWQSKSNAAKLFCTRLLDSYPTILGLRLKQFVKHESC